MTDPGLRTASEDVGALATASAAPCVFWLLGGADARDFAARAALMTSWTWRKHAQPSNHSPLDAPVIEPTLSIGVAALVTAAQTWLPRAT